MAKKRKTLPKDFEDLLKAGDLTRLKAVYDLCEPDAHGGLWKTTALGFDECPDELAQWLVAQGANPSLAGDYGRTPLHLRARSYKGRIQGLLDVGADPNAGEGVNETPLHYAADSGNDTNVSLLLKHGAKVDALNGNDDTPLEYALARGSNAGLEQLAKIADLLIAAGARRSDQMREDVRKLGKNFEFHRARFNPKSLPAADAALQRLYKIFAVAPVEERAMHDGVSPIAVDGATWEDRHQQLWELLVPSQGAAATVQGEIVRIAGKITHELDGNGGGNWDNDYRKMADAFLVHVGSGSPLPPQRLAEAGRVVAEAKRKGDDPWRLAQLAVEWVALNPDPVPLPTPTYTR